MLVKFSNPGFSYTVQCDAVGVESLAERGTRVRVRKDGQYVFDALIGYIPDGGQDEVLCYERAYVMENGVTVDTIK